MVSPVIRPASDLPAPPEEALGASRLLLQQICQEIEGAGGWISFARYMELALYAPGLGYYSGGSAKLGGAGDFVTAPELSPLFAQSLARQVAQVLATASGGVLELGAGSGSMAAELLLELDRLQSLPERYAILEVSPELRERQKQRLTALPVRLSQRVSWLGALPDAWTGVVVANEVLDALPVHLVGWSDELRERGVTVAGVGVLAWQDAPLQNERLRRTAQRIEVPEGYVSEIGLAAPALVEGLAACLRRGVLLFIDYGFGRAEYYHPQRSRGTLMCHYRHRAHDDAFFLPGLQDITAHVDFTAVAEAGVGRGLDLLGYTNQASFLINLGVTDLLARMQPGTTAYLQQAAAAQKLLSPSEMGELFKVIALGRDVPPLQGFTRGDLKRLL
jgi:SAM-dependent MidA family methyltransferase